MIFAVMFLSVFGVRLCLAFPVSFFPQRWVRGNWGAGDWAPARFAARRSVSGGVAQTFSLLYRRFPTCGRCESQRAHAALRRPAGLEVGATWA